MLTRSNSARLLLLPVAVGASLIGSANPAFADDLPSSESSSDSTLTAASEDRLDDLLAKYDDGSKTEVAKSYEVSKSEVQRAATTAVQQACIGRDALSSVEYKVDGKVVDDLRGNTHEGAKVEAKFEVADGCADVPVGLAAYKAPGNQWDPSKASEQVLSGHQTGSFGGDGTSHTLAVTLGGCNYQVDFFTGPVLESLTADKNYNNPISNLISADNGGTKSCDVTPDTPPVVVEEPPVVVDECPTDVAKRLVSFSYTINGVAGFDDLSSVKSGDTIEVDFTIAAGCEDEKLSFVSYTAPSAEFSRDTADQQVLFDSETGTFDAGSHELTVTGPACYFQIDFVSGDVLNKLGPDSSNNFYSDQGRLIDFINGGQECVTPPEVLPDEEVPPTVPETPVTPAEVLGEVVLAAPAAEATVQPAQLAQTGVETSDLLALGSTLLLLGVALERAAARRRSFV